MPVGTSNQPRYAYTPKNDPTPPQTTPQGNPNNTETQTKEKDKTFYSAKLQIQENILLTEGNCIQISNIAQVSNGILYTKIREEKSPSTAGWVVLISGIISILIGAVSMSFSSGVGGFFVAIGAILLLIGIVMIAGKSPKRISDPVYGIYIVLNSGGTFSFASDNIGFLKRAYVTLVKCINSREEKPQYMTINFGDGSVTYNQEIGTVEAINQ